MARRLDRPLFIIDIAVPRDTDPTVRDLPGVTLVDVDGLKTVIDEKLEVRREAIPQVEEIIEEFIARFGAWYQSRLAVPVITSLTQKAEAIRMSELARLLGRCPDLSEREKMLVTGMSMTIVSKFLHSVVVKIRDKATSNHAEVIAQARLLDELFELDLADRMAELLPPAYISDADE
jgi:glutamyl-tRNA reductase